MARTFPFLRQNGVNVLLFLALILTGVGAWFFQSALFEASSKVAPHLQGALTARFAFDPYIWSPAAPRALRRRYVIGQVFLLCGSALGATSAWMNDFRHAGAIIAVLAFAGCVGQLIFRSIRYGL